MLYLCVCVLSLSSCLTLCDPMDCRPPGSSVHGILQARILEWNCHALLQGIFPTQGLNPHLLCLLHLQADSLPIEPPGKPNVVFRDQQTTTNLLYNNIIYDFLKISVFVGKIRSIAISNIHCMV